jgi:hypothetical protein
MIAVTEVEMPIIRRLVPMVLAVIVAVTTIEMIRRRKLREEYAMLWLWTSVVMWAFAIFPNFLGWLHTLLNTNYLTIVVMACFLFLSLISLHYAVVISRQADQIRQLAECLALLQVKLDRKADASAGASPAQADPPAAAKNA